MRKFNKSFIGYDVNEVNHFVDGVIKQLETILNEEKKLKNELLLKDKQLKELEETINRYKGVEQQLKDSIIKAQESNEYIKRVAKSEGDAIIDSARTNANRIVSDALIRAQRTEYETQVMRKNVNLFKERVRTMLNQQLDIIDDLDKEVL